MHKFIKLLSIGFLSAFLICIIIVPTFASGPNYGTSSEHLNLYYDGYVQCRPSYNDGGYHAARGYFHYTYTADTSYYYTSYGRNKHDGSIYSRSARVFDDITEFKHKAGFYYNFDWVSDNSDAWPI